MNQGNKQKRKTKMTGKKKYEPKMLYSVTLDDLVPEDDFYRKLESILDLRFLYKEVASLYGKTGKPSIDPVVFIKLLLYGYFEGIISDRQLIRKASDSLSARYYLGYDIDEELPWHSTISRTRKLYDEEIFEKVFAIVLEQSIEAGLVSGEHQSIDSTLVKANASLDSLQRRLTITDLKKYLEQTKQENKLEEENKSVKDKDDPPKQKTTSNKEYVSKTDPDSKIRKKGKHQTDLYYSTHYSVDSKTNVITDAYAVGADKPDMVYLPAIIERIKRRSKEHGFKISSISADKGYFSGENLSISEKGGIVPQIPMEYVENRTGFYDKKEFRYDKTTDEYICPAGNKLKYFCDKKDHKAKGYRASRKECVECRLKKKCTNTQSRIIYRSYYTEEYERLSQRMKTEEFKIAMKYRKIGPELLFAEAKKDHGLRKFMSRGLSSAQKNSLMIATVQNIKRLLKAEKKKITNTIESVQKYFSFEFKLELCLY
ncbi:MAG: IS1182 family transposase [Melioribacteraceae bacterium]|nr:IS1182 family transposase [Melioribacteraceae bacterium]MCZ7602264.1 IS1182 family transposase [Melioribacteraceae bacterium]